MVVMHEGTLHNATDRTSTPAPPPPLRSLPDGKGVLADGTRYEKLSGRDYGEHGYCKVWTLLRGTSTLGQVRGGGGGGSLT